MFRITYRDGWLQAETHDAAVGFYTKYLTPATRDRLKKAVRDNEFINEDVADNRISGWYNRMKQNERNRAERFTKSQQSCYKYKTVAEMIE